MTIEDLNDKGWISKGGRISPKAGREIIKENIDISPFKTAQEFLFCKHRGIKEPPKCYCGNTLNFKSGYKEFCSPSCSTSSKKTQAKLKMTNLVRYGSEYAIRNKKIKEKMKETNLERYGVPCTLQNVEIQEIVKETNLERYGGHPSRNETIKEKIKETNLERYGVECGFQNEDIKEKIKETNLERYGVENPFQNEDIKEKIKVTNLERYGVECGLQNEEVRKKTNKTYLERYGGHPSRNEDIKEKIKVTNILKFGGHPSRNEDIKEKIKETNLERYGVENPFQNEDIKEKIKVTNLELYGVENVSRKHIKNESFFNATFSNEKFVENKKFKRFEFMNFFNVGDATSYKMMKKLGVFPEYKWTTQREIFDFLGGHEQNFSYNIKSFISPMEIDILNEELKFCVEYDGLMFHSFGKSKYSMFENTHKENKGKHIHLEKTKLCEEKGYQLFHIFENEWLQKREIWESILNSKLQKTKRIYARNCEVREVSYKNASYFENKNHLQGAGLSSIRIGLYNENELISLMTFGISRFNKRYQYELIRFCSKLNTTVVGGASKLLKYFERNYKPESLVTYANRRWSQGNLYEKLGFTFSHLSPPNFFYFKESDFFLESRNKFQKHKLEKILEVYDASLSGTENVYNNGFRKIYDSGNKVYFKKYTL